MCTFKDETHDDEEKSTHDEKCGTLLLCLHKLMFRIFQLIQADTCAYLLKKRIFNDLILIYKMNKFKLRFLLRVKDGLFW